MTYSDYQLNNFRWNKTKYREIDNSSITSCSSSFAMNIPLNAPENNLLSRQWKYVLPTVLFAYILLQTSIGIHSKYSSSPICSDEFLISGWVKKVNLVIVLCFFVSACSIIRKISMKKNREDPELLSALYANLSIKIIAGSSSFLTWMWIWGGICRDCFGVISPAAQWPEWMTSVPLLLYIAVSCEVKDSLTIHDVLVIILMFFAIFTGFVALFPIPYWIGMIVIFISCACVISVLYLAILSQRQLSSIISTPLWAMHKETELGELNVHISKKSQLILLQKKKLESALKKKNLAIICLIGMPLFPSIYFLSAFSIIGDEVSYTSTMIVGMIVKLFVVTIVSEGHLSATEDLNYIIKMHNLEFEADAIKKAVKFAQNKYYKMKLSNGDLYHHNQPLSAGEMITITTSTNSPSHYLPSSTTNHSTPLNHVLSASKLDSHMFNTSKSYQQSM